MAGYYWVDTDTHGYTPSTALEAGRDLDGQPIYVGRAYYEGDWIPTKVIPGRRCAYISYSGKEIPIHKYQILCEQRFEWVRSHNGGIPPDAVVGGRTADGENLYIGRVRHAGTLTVGKIHPSHNTCYIAYDGREISHKEYEVLVVKR